MKNTNWVINSIIFTIAILVFAIVLESSLRMLWDNPYSKTKNHIIELRLNPGGLNNVIDRSWLDLINPEVNFRTNSRGYILPADQHEYPDFTIAFLGGSTTECSYVSENLRFPALVSELFGEHGLRVNTLNGGRSGNTTQDVINIIVNDLAATPPDVMVMMEATNDLGVLSQDSIYQSRMASPLTLRMQTKWVIQSGSAYSYLLGFVRSKVTSILASKYEKIKFANENEVIHQLLPPNIESKYISRLYAFIYLARSFGSQPVLMTQPLAPYKNTFTPDWSNNAQQERFNELIRQIGIKEDVLVVDLANSLSREVSKNDRWLDYLYDGMHATDLASKFYARTIVDKFIENAQITKNLKINSNLQSTYKK